MMRRLRYPSLLLLGALGACRGGATEDPVEPAPEVAPTQAPSPAPEAAQRLREDGTPLVELERATMDAFGLAVPRGATMVEQGEGARHFRTRASLDELIAFFDANSPGGVTVEHFERGARLTPRDADGRVIFVYYDQTPAVFTLSYLDTSGRFATTSPDAAAASTSGAGSATTGAGSAPPPGGGDRVVPAGPPPVASRSAAVQAQSLREQMGGEVPADDAAARVPAPVAAPVAGGAYSEEGASRSYRPPLRFVRGVREPRRNPDAMF